MVMGGAWVYGSGFPKSLDVAKAIDARGARDADSVALLKDELRRVFDQTGMTLGDLNERCGFEASGYLRTSSTWASLFPSPEKWARMREIVGGDEQLGEKFRAAEREVLGARDDRGRTKTFGGSTSRMADITAPATDAAREWQGWGTALKPAHEPYILARKPLDYVAPPRPDSREGLAPMSLADYACADEPAHVFAYWGDCLTFLRSLPDDWTHAIITDPPYGLADHKASVVATAITAWAAGDRERVPTGRGFMGREWDAFVPPPAVWDECLRVLKPGGHLAVFAGSRTVDLMGLSIRLAGFEMRDSLAAWLYGSGFPKSLDVGKAIEKSKVTGDSSLTVRGCAWIADECDRLGVTRRALDEAAETSDMGGWWASRLPHRCALPTAEQWAKIEHLIGASPEWLAPVILPANAPGEAWGRREVVGKLASPAGNGAAGTIALGGAWQDAPDVTVPATDAAREWQGWGTALKPSHEPILLARKPLSGTVAANVLAHRTGAINVDACRVASATPIQVAAGSTASFHGGEDGYVLGTGAEYREGGRWPTNVVLAHHPGCRETDETRAVKTGTAVQRNRSGEKPASVYGTYGTTTDDQSYATDGVEHMAVFECHGDCQVAALDEQSGYQRDGVAVKRNLRDEGASQSLDVKARTQRGDDVGFGGGGGASRFFPTFRYQAKAPKSERPIVDGTGHPTVKPLGLMRWLVRLLVPGEDGDGGCGAVLDPFAGSGATLEAARLEGRRAIGVERDEHSVRLIAERLGVEYREPPAAEEPAAPELEPKPEPVEEPVTLDDARSRRHELATKLRRRAEEVIVETLDDPALATRHALATKLLHRAEEVIAETAATEMEAVPA